MKQRVHIMKPFTILQIPALEKWLETQTASGYKLICIKGFRFTFEKSKEKKRKYFVYKSPLFLKQDTFLNEFNTAKQRYALRKSMINKAECDIFEIDQAKVDPSFKFYFFSIENGHEFPNPHVYPHINYVVGNMKGTLRITSIGQGGY